MACCVVNVVAVTDEDLVIDLLISFKKYEKKNTHIRGTIKYDANIERIKTCTSLSRDSEGLWG